MTTNSKKRDVIQTVMFKTESREDRVDARGALVRLHPDELATPRKGKPMEGQKFLIVGPKTHKEAPTDGGLAGLPTSSTPGHKLNT